MSGRSRNGSALLIVLGYTLAMFVVAILAFRGKMKAD